MSPRVRTPFLAYSKRLYRSPVRNRARITDKTGTGHRSRIRHVDGGADAVHAQRVGLARAAGRAARHDDDLVADGAPAEGHQGRVDLVDHLVGVTHRRGDERLDPPGEGELAAGGGIGGE